MKILFLDFDGVLHPASHGIGYLFSKAQLLQDAMATADIPIVISSSWRFTHTLKALTDKLPKALGRRVIDVTGGPVIGRHSRFQEIMNYLSVHKEYSDWRALDDSYWEFPSSCKELIRCNPNSGITEKEMKALDFWLNS